MAVKNIHKEKIILTMPVFNEIEVIEEVVRKNLKYVKKFKNGQLLISEDGSNDGTKQLLKKLQKELKFILHGSTKRRGAVQGQKDALRYALNEGADVVLLSDSDNQHDPNDFNLLLEKLKYNDMVVGYKNPRNDPVWRKWGSKVWNFYIRVFFGMNLHDVNCGFRVMRREMLGDILPLCTTFQECFPSELSIRGFFKGFKIEEVSIKHFMRGDQPKAWNPKKIPLMAIKLFFKSLNLRRELGFRIRDRRRMQDTYNDYYATQYSFRENWFGPVAKKYILPKYFKLVSDFIKNRKTKVSILEIGAGDGEVTDLMRKKRPSWILTPTEYAESGVRKLKKKGYRSAAIVDAVNIPYDDSSFDYVVCFDVMHHVDGPAKMAQEMTRVAKKGVFLIEANRKSIVRRILEKTKIYRRAGEFSYYPIEYKAFFNLPNVSSVKIKPFQFIPPKLSSLSLQLVVLISELMEKLPILRWQCSGVAIRVEKMTD